MKPGKLIQFQIPMIETKRDVDCNMWQFLLGIIINQNEEGEYLVFSGGDFFSVKQKDIITDAEFFVLKS